MIASASSWQSFYSQIIIQCVFISNLLITSSKLKFKRYMILYITISYFFGNLFKTILVNDFSLIISPNVHSYLCMFIASIKYVFISLHFMSDILFILLIDNNICYWFSTWNIMQSMSHELIGLSYWDIPPIKLSPTKIIRLVYILYFNSLNLTSIYIIHPMIVGYWLKSLFDSSCLQRFSFFKPTSSSSSNCYNLFVLLIFLSHLPCNLRSSS